MTFPSVRTSQGGSESTGLAPSYLLPPTILAGDLILLIAGTDGVATHTVPSGFTEILQESATAFQAQVFGKVAAGTEGGTTVDGTLSATESMCYQALAIQDFSGDLADVQLSTLAVANGETADPASVTATWGSDDNLFIAFVIADLWDKIATVFPTDYDDNQLTQQHSDEFGGTQAVSIATRELASASDDPSAFTIASGSTPVYATGTIVIKPAAAGGGGGNIVVSDSIPLTVQAGWTNLVLASPLTTSGYMLEGFTGDAPVTGDTMEYETTTDLSPDAASQWIWDVAPIVDQVVGRRVIQVDGTVGDTSDITFTIAVDTTIPVITLFGDNPETVVVDTSWSEAGYIAIDDVDGDITVRVAVAGDTVDISTVGVYSITYDVDDASDNSAVQKIRTVNVVPESSSTIPPENRTYICKIADSLRALETFDAKNTNEIVVEWLLSEGVTRGALNGMLYGYLGSLGYTGSIDDRMKQWRLAG